MKNEKLTEMLAAHAAWAHGDKDGCRANLTGANLTGANLRGANLTDANLTDAKLPHYQIPQEGSLVVWKKAAGHLVKLRIPASAKRSASLVGRKCRASAAKVLFIDGAESVTTSKYKFAYTVGETVTPDFYDQDPRVECSHGIHFFLTREEAEEWTL